MKKDKAWLKKQFTYYREAVGQTFNDVSRGMNNAYDNVEKLIDQLDEPEVLSQEWVREHTWNNHYIGKPFVYVDDLQNLIVPKQEKPIIPQFVADYIESQDDPIYEMCINYEMWGVNGDDGTTSFTGEIAEWFDDTLNVENYYRACIDGYEVEKKKRYYIVDKANNSTLMTFELSDVVGEEVIEFVYGYSENETIHFNSKEKAELIAHFVGESLEVEEVTE